MIYLHAVDSEGDRQLILPPKGVVSIGRSRRSDLVLTGEEVSRTHLEVRMSGRVVEARDLGTANGTLLVRTSPRGTVQDVPIGSDWSPVQVGDTLMLGPSARVTVRDTLDSLPPRPPSLPVQGYELPTVHGLESSTGAVPGHGVRLFRALDGVRLACLPPEGTLPDLAAAVAALREAPADFEEVVLVASRGGSTSVLARSGARGDLAEDNSLLAAAMGVLAAPSRTCTLTAGHGGSGPRLACAAGRDIALVARLRADGPPASNDGKRLLEAAADLAGRAFSILAPETASASSLVRGDPPGGAAPVALPVLDTRGFEGLAQGGPLRLLLERVARAAGTDKPILLSGETGVGKELVARFIHHASGRPGRFVSLAPASIPTTLMESELFGWVRGAFSGAEGRREGAFARAEGGTLFLDEIGETPPEVQAKLLRVLQERAFNPLGSDELQAVDFRIVAATNRDLKAEVGRGAFRQDLLFRLKHFSFVIPPLRERRDEILPLARHLLERERPGLVLDREAALRLLSHSWPGNVREMQGVMARAAQAAADRIVRPEHLDLDDDASPGAGAATSPSPEWWALPWTQAKAAFERGYLQQVLTAANGNVSRAARLAALDRKHVHRRLRHHGLGTAGPVRRDAAEEE